MHPVLQRAHDEISRATGHLTVDQIARPVAGKWSVAEILEHLTLAFRTNLRGLEKAMAQGEPLARRPSPKQACIRMLVVDVGYFPEGAKAPDVVVPRGTIAPELSRDALLEALAGLDEGLSRAAERFGEGTPLLSHPYFAAMTVGDWRKFHWRHAAHHMKQVRRRVAAPQHV
jgi:hypothetical protein